MIEPSKPVDFLIRGLTLSGRQFRPSDWAERLAGVMVSFRPPGNVASSPLEYSPWVQPVLVDGVRCVSVSAEIAAHEPLAYVFLLNFAKDNELQVEPR